jgi:hypothetical protein
LGAAGATVVIPATSARAFGITTDGSEWRPLSADLASETAPGIVEIATTAEAQAGTSNALALTPLRLQDVTATETRKGVVELATNAEAQTGTDTTRAITAANLQAVTATETRKGVIELATGSEASLGTDTERALTPYTLQNVVANINRPGVIELATQTEVDAGTDAGRALTPVTYTTNLNTRLGTTGNLGNQDQTVELLGGFSAGESVRVVRIGNVVSLTTVGVLSHSSASGVSSNSGVLPSWARPEYIAQSTYSVDNTTIRTIKVFPAGTVVFTYADPADGIGVPRTDTSDGGVVSYIAAT